MEVKGVVRFLSDEEARGAARTARYPRHFDHRPADPGEGCVRSAHHDPGELRLIVEQVVPQAGTSEPAAILHVPQRASPMPTR